MSPTGNKLPTNPSSLANLDPSHSYKEARTSRWHLQALFQSFLEDRSADTLLAIQERRLLISWDLKAIHYLRRCLRAWILDQVPGDAIGAFLVTILYEQDFHLDYRLTMMVRERQTQLHIARRLLAFYQIRDDTGAPIWDNVAVYAEDAPPNTPAHGKSVSGCFDATKDLPPRIPTPLPADGRWPLFMGALSDPELEDLMDRLADDDDHVEGDSPLLFTVVREEDIPIIQAFRRFNLHKNDFSEDLPLPESGTDRIEYTSNPTNRLQDKPLPSIPNFTPVRKPLPAIPIDKALPHNPLLPLPPLSRPAGPSPSSRNDKTGLRSSATSRPKPTPSVNINQQAPHPSGIIYIPCHIHHNASPPPPGLKRKAAVEDLRKAREQGMLN
ncbi:hypothetical protein PENCOP_c007G01579 [Penicillium coprophilum]|uniref:Uncharacterized protein n=1 Tax=Penicillium coprophilum TaxID=36646 RepID=A0A1V6UL97_9EURO|nr:hypothetical protein PENCOP_c007G01579 [Penicillium coprophilum]